MGEDRKLDHYDLTIGGRKVQTTHCADVANPADGRLADAGPWRPLVGEVQFGSPFSIIDDRNLAEAGAGDNPSGIRGFTWSSDMAATNEVTGHLDDGLVWINGSI